MLARPRCVKMVITVWSWDGVKVHLSHIVRPISTVLRSRVHLTRKCRIYSGQLVALGHLPLRCRSSPLQLSPPPSPLPAKNEYEETPGNSDTCLYVSFNNPNWRHNPLTIIQTRQKWVIIYTSSLEKDSLVLLSNTTQIVKGQTAPQYPVMVVFIGLHPIMTLVVKLWLTMTMFYLPKKNSIYK